MIPFHLGRTLFSIIGGLGLLKNPYGLPASSAKGKSASLYQHFALGSGGEIEEPQRTKKYGAGCCMKIEECRWATSRDHILYPNTLTT